MYMLISFIVHTEKCKILQNVLASMLTFASSFDFQIFDSKDIILIIRQICLFSQLKSVNIIIFKK